MAKINLTLYKRLFEFAKPYSFKITVGVIAGIISAGSFFGLLALMPNAFSTFGVMERQEHSVAQTEEKVGGTDTHFTSTSTGSLFSLDEPMPNDADNMPGWFRQAEKIAKTFDIPLRNADNTLTWQALFLGLIALPIVAICRILSSFLNRYFMRWVGVAVVRDIRDSLFISLQKQSLKFYGKCDIGNLISRCVNDTAQIEHLISVTVADAFRAPFEIVAAILVAILYTLQNDLGRFLGFGLLLPICLVPVIILGQRVRRWSHRALEKISLVVSRMHENFTGIRVVKAFNTEAAEAERFKKMNFDYFKSSVHVLLAELLMSPMMEFVVTLLACGFVMACFICHVRLDQIIVIGVAVYAAYRPVKQLAQITAQVQRGAAALERIYAILDTDTSLPEPQNPRPKKTFDDKIVFDKVSFAFDETTPILRDLDITMPRGTLTALVGETGSGKTTIANLLARFYDPTSGRVIMDGRDMRDIAGTDIHRLVGVVTQDTVLFNTTIAENIAYGTPEATREQIEEAARLANAHDFIVDHPEGYERICGDKGFVLSGGEKQRVALARAILRNPPILILDEATSALDTVTERLVQEAIARVMKNRTTLAIAHRLSTVRDADQILVIEHGRIVERGTHDELYAANGRYRRLCDIQLAQ